MRLFAISDLHLSFGVNKPMDVFSGWENYTDRLKTNWEKVVDADDTVVIAGDVSWGISLEESLEDFRFLNSLSGKKIIIKGNHDYWWSTVTKIKKFFDDNGLDTLNILHNNCYFDGKIAICGTRGWVYDGTGEKDEKVISRECGRLDRSLSMAKDLGAMPLTFLHYPPAYGEYVCDEIVSVLKKHEINTVYYGHIHGSSTYKALTEYGGIKLKILSADSVGFTPILIGNCRIFK
ncbi:MAG: metallophosphoesterase [Clostridia bacterium]|nr:metallophosphoesterase [Clostridia bacterium]